MTQYVIYSGCYLAGQLGKKLKDTWQQTKRNVDLWEKLRQNANWYRVNFPTHPEFTLAVFLYKFVYTTSMWSPQRDWTKCKVQSPSLKRGGEQFLMKITDWRDWCIECASWARRTDWNRVKANLIFSDRFIRKTVVTIIHYWSIHRNEQPQATCFTSIVRG